MHPLRLYNSYFDKYFDRSCYYHYLPAKNYKLDSAFSAQWGREHKHTHLQTGYPKLQTHIIAHRIINSEPHLPKPIEVLLIQKQIWYTIFQIMHKLLD